jgi:pyridoxamine 5'-phosphate oxidase
MTSDERALCWAEFERATRERGHAFRQPVVMSVDEEGFPAGRVLTLRAAVGGKLRFHVDRRSPKFEHWMRQPIAGAVFYDAAGKWQVRVKGLAELHFEDDVARAAWEPCHPMSKRTYLTTTPPGGELDWDAASAFPVGLEKRRPTEAESEAGYRNFAVLLLEVIEMDSLHLAGEGHMRFHISESAESVRRLAP